MHAVSLAGALLLASQANAASGTCDRVCLGKALDQYMSAVFKHDPQAAPLAANYRSTENAEEVAAGAGVWQVATGYGEVARRFFDPMTQQAIYFGILQEGAGKSIVSVRLKLNAARQISEAEWTIARKEFGGLFSVEGLIETPPPQRVLPLSDRVSRAEMLKTANAYFDGIEKHDGSAVPKIAGCERIENGFKVTNRVLRLPPPGTPNPAITGGATSQAPSAPPAGSSGAPAAAQEVHAGDCTDGFEMFAKTIANATPRRGSFIDEEQGVLVMMTILRRPPGVQMKRNLLTEYFFLKQGKIDHITTAMYYLDPSAPDSSGWPAN
jgi:hypothetical protein